MAMNVSNAEPPIAPPSSPRLEAALARGVALHDAGKLEEAAGVYQAMLEEAPRHVQALTHLGLARLQQGRLKEAAKCLGDSLALDPEQPLAHNNLGKTLHLLGDDEAAIRSFDRAIALNPNYAQAYHNRGRALRALGRAEPAVASFDLAIELRPDYPQAHEERGYALQTLGRTGEARRSFRKVLKLRPELAINHNLAGNRHLAQSRPEQARESYERSIALDPGYAVAHYNLGNALRKLGRQADALKSYDRAIALKPDYSNAFNNRGNALKALRRFDEALASFEKAIALDPLNAHAHNNLGLALQLEHRYEEALASLDKCLEIEPDRTDVLNNRGNLLIVMDRPDEAAACFDRAIAIAPDNAKGYWNKSLLLLLHGDFAEGWKLYEWRRRNVSLEIAERRSDKPYWLGDQPIEGKTILLYAEQGLGDTLQLCRYAERVAQRGARVVLEVQAPLVPLLSDLAGVSALIATGDRLPPHDLQCSILSLPLAFNTSLDNIPGRTPYLTANRDAVARWAATLGKSSGPRVGLVWSGDSIHKNDHNRSIPLERLLPLTQCGVELIGLQKEPRESDRATLDKTPAIKNLGPAFEDFADTAAVVAQLDLVISVDTSVAHLAGALGKPVWLLLPRVPDWRWLLHREDSPWYPTMRLFRQTAFGDWASVIARVSDMLKQRDRDAYWSTGRSRSEA